MPNFFEDNDDIQFLFNHLDLAEVAEVQERGFTQSDGPGKEYAPLDAQDAIDNYRRVLAIVGDIAGNHIAPRAGAVDIQGNTLNEDGTVTLGPGVQENLKILAQADLMGFTLPRKYGGLNCPNLVYTMATEIVSRADASLMNLFGLQGIAETINAWASQEIKDEYLPRFCGGKVTGAMVLTEPDAGSDLQAISLRAWQDGDGGWRLTGVKRFITNGCGEILLTLARSEPDMSDGRGLSLFLAERCEQIKVRHLEDKLGIHGSPTCELVYDDAPAKLIGERQRGLITYVMGLMNGARIGIAAQSLGIAEAAFCVARQYAHTRRQFGVAIEKLPAVAKMLADMRIAIEAARALTYEAACFADFENNNIHILESNPPTDKAEFKKRKADARMLKRLNGMLTPMCKYYASEMCNRVANDALQVLGGSGYMKDYPVERLLRDARITTIYEGTSQLQVVAAVRGVCSGVFEKHVEGLEQREYTDKLLNELKQKLDEGKQRVLEGVAFVKERGPDYMDLYGRKLVDSAIAVLVGHWFLRQAASKERQAATDEQLAARKRRKQRVARRFIESNLPTIRRDIELVCSGDTSALDELETLAGPPITAS
ncbi:MAG: acyl-CoA dehydrogenase family protein [Phycisphaerae bacterium]|nr:acyl-CoA dehydrogenase family protein [Phycisphaerae bacterium]